MFSFKPVDVPEFVVPANWVYRGEGNCNVVIAIPDFGKILRIRKVFKLRSFFSWILCLLTDLFSWYKGGRSGEEIRDVGFYRRVMRPLLGEDYVCDAEPVFLSWRQVKFLDKELCKLRPDFRKTKIIQHGRAALFDDYAFLPNQFNKFKMADDTFAVEIKPKQGWTPFSERYFPRCTFCMNQYLKLANCSIKGISSYCPSDLFSGDEKRMINAIRALIQQPQNNFRVFKNGQLAYDERQPLHQFNEILGDIFKQGSIEEFCTIIQQSLIRNFEQKQSSCDKKLYCEWNAIIKNNSLNNRLPKGCALEKILSVQMLDVEGNEYYAKLMGEKKLNDFDYVRMLVREVRNNKNTCLKCSIMMAAQSNEDLVFAPYLISAVAKDCSIMITFRKFLDNYPKQTDFNRNFLRTTFGDFIVSVKILDLYPKPLSTIRKKRKKIENLLKLDLGNKVCHR